MAEFLPWFPHGSSNSSSRSVINRSHHHSVNPLAPSASSMYATRAEQRDVRFCFCNCQTCCYFILALFFFTTGTAITVLTLGGHVGFVLGLGHLWVIGPVFICSGLMIAIKTILYARRQTIVAILTRRDLHCPAEDMPSPRDPASYILPPSYDSIAGESSNQTGSHLLPATLGYGIPQPNHPPPCYEEALLGSSMEPIHYQGIKGYSLSKPDNLEHYEYDDDNKSNERRG